MKDSYDASVVPKYRSRLSHSSASLTVLSEAKPRFLRDDALLYSNSSMHLLSAVCFLFYKACSISLVCIITLSAPQSFQFLQQYSLAGNTCQLQSGHVYHFRQTLPPKGLSIH